jgi:hypothetical protein
MATSFTYRRNGRYYARLRIPKQYQAVYARTHLRQSLGTTDANVARIRVHEVLLRWRRDFERVKVMLDLDRLSTGSPLLLGDGLVTLGSAARESGIAVADMVTEALNRQLELRVECQGWWGTDMAADALEFEHGGSHKVGTTSPAVLVVDCVQGRDQAPIVGTLFLRRADLSMVTSNAIETCLLYRDAQRRHAVVFPWPGVSVPLEQLLIGRADAERLRQDLASKITPEMIQAARATRAAVPAHVAAPKHKYGAMKSSELLDKFFTAKANDWSKATKIDMNTMCGAFVDVMRDPLLSEIDGPMILDYRTRLARLPNHIGLARRKTKLHTFTDLVDAAPAMGRMQPARINEYVGKLSEFLGWATGNGFIDRNPAAGAMRRAKRTRREQDERQPITAENLSKIFAVDWFKHGRGERTARGLHHSFQPHYYWLPLLGLYVGGRLNELSQLYLDDLKQAPTGTWYIDFNTDQQDKRDIDEADTITVGTKRLKTVNAQRVVPLHPRLIQLGLIDYVVALRATGKHVRLFPELLWNETKGYSKQSSRWFNELFMGKKLKSPRDGSQVFHSLRHNFITALTHLEIPDRVVAELAGHERGDTMAAKRYAKDRTADKLAPHVERLAYELPPITRFDVADGLVALEHALARK